MRIATANTNQFLTQNSHSPAADGLLGFSHPRTRALFQRMSWLSNPISWFARRVETEIKSLRRSPENQATLAWEDYGVSISYVGGRLVMSLYRHNAGGSVVGYVVEEVIGDETPDFRFANRGWSVRK